MKFISTLIAASLAFAEAQTPNGGYRTETHGGSGGNPFDHYSSDRSARPDVIRVNAGTVIDQICGRYTQTLQGNSIEKCAGRTGGRQYEFFLDVKRGEYVNRIDYATGTRLDGIQFHTNHGHSTPWYGGGAHLPNRTITMNSNMQLYSFFGRANAEVDQIGFVIGPDCLDIGNREGKWTVLQSSNGGQEVRFSKGTTNSWTTETSTTFGEESTRQFSNSFRSSSSSITNKSSEFVADSASTEFSESEEISQTYTFPKPGTLWQWEFDSTGVCGTSRTKTHHIMLTDDGSQRPCCLPTAFRDFNNPHGGGCVGLEGEPAINLC